MPIATALSHQRQTGQYMTPTDVAQAMASHARPEDLVRVLDPAAGHGELLVAAAHRAADLGSPSPQLFGIELDPAMGEQFRASLGDRAEFQLADFLRTGVGQIDPTMIIANPPYGKGREYDFFVACDREARPGTLIIFLVPLAFVDRIEGVEAIPVSGSPFGVTTGHAIVVHRAGDPYRLKGTHERHVMTGEFLVHTGLKVYERGAGTPPQDEETVRSRRYSSDVNVDGWIPCLRTGDVLPGGVNLSRQWVNYGDHLASPKSIERFRGPRLVVRRVPIWKNRHLCAQFIDVDALCAGDLLIVQHQTSDRQRLNMLGDWINSTRAAELIHQHRPTVRLRASFPKISAKDLTWLIGKAESEGAI